MQRSILILFLSLGVTFSACTTLPSPSEPSSTPPPSITNPQNPWLKHLSNPTLPSPWQVIPAEGSAPLLVIQRGGVSGRIKAIGGRTKNLCKWLYFQDKETAKYVFFVKIRS